MTLSQEQIEALKHYIDIKVEFALNRDAGRPNYAESDCLRMERDFDRVMLGPPHDSPEETVARMTEAQCAMCFEQFDVGDLRYGMCIECRIIDSFDDQSSPLEKKP